jgi:hypothetical protein
VIAAAGTGIRAATLGVAARHGYSFKLEHRGT